MRINNIETLWRYIFPLEGTPFFDINAKLHSSYRGFEYLAFCLYQEVSEGRLWVQLLGFSKLI